MKKEHENAAGVFCDAVRKLASNPAALENLENYLAMHFGEWLEKYASTPGGIAYEMKSFSEIN